MKNKSLFKWLFGAALTVTYLFSCQGQNWGTADIAVDDIKTHVTYLAADELEGRETGTTGEQKAGDYIAEAFSSFGLDPAGENGTYFHSFDAIAGVNPGNKNALSIIVGGETESLRFGEDFTAFGHTENGDFEGEVVFAGFGIQAPDLNYDEYAGIDVKDKIVVAFRHTPVGDDPHSDFFAHSAERRKAITAREQGAKAVIFLTAEADNPEDALAALRYDRTSSRSGVGLAHLKRQAAEKLFEAVGKSLESVHSKLISTKKPNSFEIPNVKINLTTDVQNDERIGRNVAGFLEGSDPALKEEIVIIGAHYDHLGYGGSGSLDVDKGAQIHNGADDNASGTAGLIELAQKLSANRASLKRSHLFIAFSGEELGLLGSKAYVESSPISLENAVAMMNMDMIGRLRDDELVLYGMGTAPIWSTLVDSANQTANSELTLKKNDDGEGPSDFASFYRAKMPVLALFTNVHDDYHKASDDAHLINYEGEKRVLDFAYETLLMLDDAQDRPQFTEVEAPQERPVRAFRVYLGTIPDYGDTDVEGLKLSGVRKGGPAEKAGIKGGDIIVKFGEKEVKNIYDYMYALQTYKPGDQVEIVVLRGEDKISLPTLLVGKE